MDTIPFSALALVVVALLLIWLFLAHMIANRKEDARLQFLLSLMEPPAVSKDCPSPAVVRTAAYMPGDGSRGNPGGLPRDAQSVWEELPLLLAAAMRGRAL
jgi:hypothetical protein